MVQVSDSDSARFWIMRTDFPDGPFDIRRIHELLNDGTIGWQTLACRVGHSEWRALLSMPGVGPTAVSEAVQPVSALRYERASVTSDHQLERSDAVEKSAPTPTARPWNPKLIIGLSFVFTPIWGGVMAAINGSRLKSARPIWIPLLIGFGYAGVDAAVEALIESYLLSWMIYLAALALLWFVVLRDQTASIESGFTGSPWTGSWVWPSIAGVPFAILFVLGAVVAPLMPLDPTQVCERFIVARSEDQLMACATQNLKSSLGIFTRINASDSHWELVGEEPAPEEFGGHLVGFRLFSNSALYRRTEGAFYLINWKGDWKIEEVYIISQGDQAFQPWGKVSVSPHLLDLVRKNASLPEAANRPVEPPNNPQKGLKENKQFQVALGRGVTAFFASGAGKAAGVALLAVLAGLFKFGKEICQAIGLTSNK